MGRDYHMNRPRGNLLPKATAPDGPRPVTRYLIDTEHFKRTGELIPLTEPEEFIPQPFSLKQDNEDLDLIPESEGKELKKVDKPSREQLIEDRKTQSNREIAKKYNVGESTVSLWVKEYGLQGKAEKIRSPKSVKVEVMSVPVKEKVIKQIDSDESLWQSIEENLKAIRQSKVAQIDQEIKERLNKILAN